MNHLDGGKIRGDHTTVIDAAYDFLKGRALKMECVSGVSLGQIKKAKCGRPAAKFTPGDTCVRAAIRSASSV